MTNKPFSSNKALLVGLGNRPKNLDSWNRVSNLRFVPTDVRLSSILSFWRFGDSLPPHALRQTENQNVRNDFKSVKYLEKELKLVGVRDN